MTDLTEEDDGKVALDSSPPQRPFRERILAGSAYSFLAIVTAQALAMVTSVIYARLLGKDNLGVLAIYAQLANVAVAFAGLGLATPITKYVAQLWRENRAQLERLLSTALLLAMGSAIVASAVLFASADFLATAYASADLGVMIRLSSLFLVLNALSSAGSSILQGLHAIRRLSALGILMEAFGIPVIFVALSIFGLVGAAIAGVVLIVLASTLIFGSAWRILHRRGVRLRPRFDPHSARTLMLFASPLLASMIVVRFAALFQSSFLALNLGYGEVGLFKVASILYHVVLFVPSAISIPLLPAMAELYASAPAKRAKEGLTTMLRATTYAGVPVALGIGLAAVPLISLLYGAEYVGVSPLVFVLVTAGFVEMISAVAVSSVLGEGRPRLVLAIDLVQVGVLVVGTVVLVRAYGLLGVGYSVLLNSVIYGAIILGVLALTGRVDARKTLSALVPAIGAFALGTSALVWGDAQWKPWLGAIIIVGFVTLCWTLMEQRERRMFTGIIRTLFHRVEH